MKMTDPGKFSPIRINSFTLDEDTYLGPLVTTDFNLNLYIRYIAKDTGKWSVPCTAR